MMTLDQRIVVKGVLERHGFHGLAGLSVRDLIQFYYQCRGTPVAVLFRPRREVMPRRIPEPRWRTIVKPAVS
jgi:hypothetical protein